jgi:AcrR family transcriptional regulator
MVPAETKASSKADAKIGKIVDAARRLFHENGFEKTTMEEIARAVPMSKATLYAVFPNKEDILLTICETHCASMVKMMRSILEKTDSDFLPALQTTLKKFVGSVYEESSSVRTPDTLVYVSARIRSRAQHKFAEMKNVIQSFLDAALGEGELAKGTDTTLQTEVIATLLGAYLPPYDRTLAAPKEGRPDRKVFDSEVDTFLHLILNGLRGTKKT